MPCSACDPLSTERPIRSPADLAEAVRVARSQLADGTLVEVDAGESVVARSLADVPEAAPWPDYVECHFACAACGDRFVLTAETYHGSGGSWSAAR